MARIDDFLAIRDNVNGQSVMGNIPFLSYDESGVLLVAKGDRGHISCTNGIAVRRQEHVCDVNRSGDDGGKRERMGVGVLT